MNSDLMIIFTLIILNIIGISVVLSKSYTYSLVNISLFSIFCAGLYLLLRAPDVGLTEASIGSCIGTAIIVSVIKNLGEERCNIALSKFSIIFYFILLIVMYKFVVLIPEFGTNASPANKSQILEFYKTNTMNFIGIESLVASILASFRGFDTFGETLVIYTAMICVLIILEIKIDAKFE